MPGAALAAPGMDPRQWCSYGIVLSDSDEAHSVRFNDENGAALPHGVLVDVKLQPSGTIVPCRVAMLDAGSGEAAWSPVGPGDEVIVLVPEGRENAGCVIVGRLPNAKDVFPTKVAGIDTTQNSVAFRRMKVPYVLESGSAILLRNALVGSQLALAADGSAFISSGDGHFLAMNSSVVMLSTGNTGPLGGIETGVNIQLDPGAKSFGVQADTASFLLQSGDSSLITPGTMSISTLGAGATQHAVTLEEVLNLLINWTIMLAGPNGSTTLNTDLTGPGKLLFTLPGDATNLEVFDTSIAALLQQAVLPTPPTASTNGGGLELFPLTFAAILTAMQTPLVIPIFQPGVGKPGLLF
jgi:hypothetical protein